MTPLFGLNVNKAKADDSVAAYIKGLAPVIAKMPGCQKVIGNGISDLFKKVKDLFSSKSGDLDIAALAPDKYSSSFDANGDEVTVNDSAVKRELEKTNAELAAAKKHQENVDNAQNCTNAIGKAIAKILINKSTDSIINWINTGDAGGPLFVQDPGAFFRSIAEDQTLGFGAEIRDPELYPFGKAFMKNQADSFKSKFANNAQYSLDTMIRDSNPNYSAETFSSDFSQGGWAAWDAMTQNPANNPLGFSIAASNELAKRIEKETSLAQGSLQMGGGFLAAKECADPKGVTKSQDELGKEERRADPNLTGPYENPICNQWVDVTPGRAVGDMLVSAVQKKDHALLDVQTLNDAMAAILDSVLAKFTSKLQVGGVANLEQPTNNEYYEFNEKTKGFDTPQNELDYSKSQINKSKWIKDHPDFNIRTDLTLAVIDEQRIYADKLKDQNKELYSVVAATDKFPLGNYGLVPTIYQLDYCIPGPHPGWESDASDNFEVAKKTVLDTTGMNFQQIYQAFGSQVMKQSVLFDAYLVLQALPFVGGSITGPDQIDNYVQMWLGTGDSNCGGGGISITGCVNTKLNVKTLEKFTHIKISAHAEQLATSESLLNLLDKIFEEYTKAINNVYIPEVLPSVAKENDVYFAKLPGYNKIYNGNKKTIETVKANVTRLTNLKKQIDDLNAELATGDFRATEGPVLTDTSEILAEYEKELTPWKLEFVRMTSGMYSGDDISAAYDATKQIIADKDYVFKNLITGKTGCEQFLSDVNSATKQENAKMPWQLSGGKLLDRPAYPMPHLYDYPSISPNGESGFLWYSGYSNWGFQPDSNVLKLCNFYEQFGVSNESDCRIQKGPNFLYVSDLLGPSNQILPPSSSKLLGGSTDNFERDVLKVW